MSGRAPSCTAKNSVSGEASSAARSTDSVRVAPPDDDLYGFSEAKGLAELSIRQQLVLPRGDDDLVDALHAVDREQCAHKDRDAVKGLQQLVLPAVARGASGGRNQRGAVRVSALLALAEHLLQQAHGLNRSPLTASRR